jgi:hypothetical protein
MATFRSKNRAATDFAGLHHGDMQTLRVIGIPPEAVLAVRRERRDAWGNDDLTPVRADAPRAYPCRVCLRDAAVGDELLLFSHSPFPGPAPYRTVGPVFVHAGGCAPWDEGAGVPEQLRTRLLSVRGMTQDLRIHASEVVPGTELEAAAARLFADEEVAALHVHFAKNGCYACRIVRR